MQRLLPFGHYVSRIRSQSFLIWEKWDLDIFVVELTNVVEGIVLPTETLTESRENMSPCSNTSYGLVSQRRDEKDTCVMSTTAMATILEQYPFIKNTENRNLIKADERPSIKTPRLAKQPETRPYCTGLDKNLPFNFVYTEVSSRSSMRT